MKEKRFFKFLFIICIICVAAFFIFKTIFNQKNINSKNLDVKFLSSDILMIDNKLPVSDTLAKSFDGTGTADGVQGYVEFSVTNLSNKKTTYEILLNKQKIDFDEIKENYIKIFLTDENDIALSGFDKNKVPNFAEFSFLKDKPGSKLIYTESISANETKTFRLRMWVSDTYTYTNYLEGFCVDIDVQ